MDVHQTIQFMDYTSDELMKIALLRLSKFHYMLTEAAKNKLEHICNNHKDESLNSYGCKYFFVENIIDMARRNQSH